jgi:hypothetical protein
MCKLAIDIQVTVLYLLLMLFIVSSYGQFTSRIYDVLTFREENLSLSLSLSLSIQGLLFWWQKYFQVIHHRDGQALQSPWASLQPTLGYGHHLLLHMLLFISSCYQFTSQIVMMQHSR